MLNFKICYMAQNGFEFEFGDAIKANSAMV